MRVIRRGPAPIVYRFECKECQSLLESDPQDYERDTEAEFGEIAFKCPNCYAVNKVYRVAAGSMRREFVTSVKRD